MCGIAGLFLKNPALELKLGTMLAGMMTVLSDRGPDSAGFAIYGGGSDKDVKVTLRAKDGDHAKTALEDLETKFGALHPVYRFNHVVIAIDAATYPELQNSLPNITPMPRSSVPVRGWKSTRRSGCRRRLPRVSISRICRARTPSDTPAWRRKSAVTTKGAHPFSTGTDQCLVHNGSLSNHNGLRRELKRNGIAFATDNDSEVAAGYLTWRMSEGSSLKQALTQGLKDLDGFYTFVVGTESGFAVLRDPISCKPAVMAETDDYVAFGSEYRALAGLPGIESARVFEPEPATVYAWERA